MTTLQLIIVCLTALAGAVITTRAIRARDASRAQLQREVAMHERAMTAPVAELADAVTALTRAAGELERARGHAGPSRVGQRVTVHTKQPDDQTLFGVVVGDYIDRIALDDAEYVTAKGARPLPGRQDIATTDIAWIDVHGRVARDPESVPAGEVS
jgi:hypothetical protein